MREFYVENSSGQYAVNGDVTDWTNVPFNEAAYGSNYCGSIVCVRDIQRLLEDGLNQWYADQLAAGKTAAQIDAYLSQFDKWDRNDYDGDGNFTEPDGYIDHFQTVHAGVGEETGGGAQGTDAIWSHRSTIVAGAGSRALRSTRRVAFTSAAPATGWATTRSSLRTAARACSRTSSATTSVCRTSTTPPGTPAAPRTAPAGGRSCLRARTARTAAEDLGTRPVHFNAWDKFQLGWLNYAVASAGKRSSVRLGPAETNTKQAQGMFVILPEEAGDHEPGRAVCRQQVLLLRHGRRSRHDDDPLLHASRGYRQLRRQGAVQHRGRLGLRVPDGQRHAGPHEPLDEHEPERAELRRGHHRRHRRAGST